LFQVEKEIKSKSKGPNEEANVVKLELGDVLFVSDGKDKFEKNWVMDTGASQHMTLNKEWFVTYESSDGVLLGNDHLCKIAGVCIAKIKMHDGIIRTLTGVRHILDLTKNLISLGSLEDAGYKFQSDGGVLKVLKCALTFMKVKKVSTLYFLEGISIVGTAVIVNSTSGSDNTKSWHMRLGHMSERGMTLLSKEYMLCGQSIGKLNIYEDCIFGKQKRDSILHLF
jgi:GAG-pre-integrase domain